MLRTLCLTALMTLIVAASASADIITIPGANTSAPDRYDHVRVDRVGPAAARTRLILLPGGYAGAGEHQLLAHDLVQRQPDLQVWIVAGRYQNLEDRRFLDGGTPDEANNYYLNGKAVDGHTFTPFDQFSAPWARSWGLATKMEDIQRVVKRARTGGRRVVLGGHSFGGYETVAYAGWDFHGRPGWKDLSGLVLIDGGVPGQAASAPSNASITSQLEEIATGSPFASPESGSPHPWSVAAFAAVASRFALEAPRAPSVLLGPLSFTLTNAGLLGVLFDKKYNDKRSIATARFGELAATGTPRDWKNGERSTVARVAQSTVGSHLNGLAFYYPSRLFLDNQVAGAGNTVRARRLGLRMFHIRSIPTPMIVFESNESKGDVLRSAHRLVKISRITAATYVNASTRTNHLDPLVDLPSKNLLLKPLVRFLAAK